ncbi:MAG: hypothetical protein ACE15B_04805 [Bryobacteraceae bacterium]
MLSFIALLVIGPTATNELDDSYKRLKDAQVKKDASLVKKAAAETCALARSLAAAPKPAAEADQAAWKQSVEYAQNIELQTEYALSALAAESAPDVAVDLLETLEKQNPKSRYLEESYGRYLLALSQSGGTARIPAVAEKGLANFPDHEDLLLVAADNAMNRKQMERALTFSRRLVAVVSKHPKPEGISAADWERKRVNCLSRGYWITGVVTAEKGLYAEADRNLRAVLPMLKGNDAMAAAAFFYLGVANHQLGQTTLNKQRVLEAQKFSEQAAKISGPLAEQAWKNALASKAVAGRMR